MPDGINLTLSTDGWPTPNPLQVRVTLHCPADRAQGCDETLALSFGSTGSLARMYGVADQNKCQLMPGSLGGPNFRAINWACYDGLVGANQSRIFAFSMTVQPSLQTTMTVNARWGNLSGAERQLGVPLAKIHPVIVIPGILGTMPPWAHTGALDPVLGVYEPLMTQLAMMGYEEESTLFRMPYDWRRSNRITARYLRDRIKEAIASSRAVEWIDPDPRAKVDLIVHSMGGLVTRSYAQGEGLEEDLRTAVGYNSDIRKVIFMATPHQGFPEDYKTFESGSWWDFLYGKDTVGPLFAMDHVFWPAFVYKHWRESYPYSAPPMDCDWTLITVICLLNEYAMTHDAAGGIESMREMLPTENADNYFGPYLCDSYPNATCAGRYMYGKQMNPLLNRMNANVNVLNTTIGSENIYLIYGVNPNRNDDGTEDPSVHNDVDVVYDVKAPPSRTHAGLNGWANGEPEQNFVTAAGDDLIPEYSSNLQVLLSSIQTQHIAKLNGKKARHLPIMYNPDVLSIHLPNFLAGLSQLPFTSAYSMPPFLIDPHQWWVLVGLCPVNLTITDPQGRRLGYDPATGTTVNEIPGMYASKNSENQFIILNDPTPGAYTVTVTAFGDGPFSLGLHQLNQAGSPRRWAVAGEVKTGQTFSYAVNIDPQLPIVQHNPVANAGPDQTVMADDSCTAPVQLDGSASSDPDGEALDFHWTGPFGYMSGAAPRVTLPVGSHEIRLVVFDGQRGGSGARTHVNVTSRKPEVRSLTPQPEILGPADNTMRDVTVIADVTTVCGIKPICRIVDVESDENIKGDWKIVGPLQVKLRAERSGDENGRKYKLRIQCQIPNGETVNKTVNVKVRPAGRMKGSGTVKHDERSYRFDFDVSESKAGKDAGEVKLEVRRVEFDNHDDKEDHKANKFRSTGTLAVVFRDDDDYQPGGKAKVDWVQVTGYGEWDGKAGYTFDMRAIDDGEPGRGRDRFKIEIRDPQGKRVAYVNEEIDSGNIQSSKPPK
jgi:pimeloyl-ACP methyl ester carboxylesterase